MSLDQLDGKYFVKERSLINEPGRYNLPALLFQSGLTDPKYVESDKWENLSQHSKWMVNNQDFIAESVTQKGKTIIGSTPVVLGISPYELTRAVGLHISGEDFEEYYKRYGIDWKSTPNHTEIFLNKIEEDPNVSSIVFLVPQDIFSFDAPPGYPWGTTRDEILYFLDHPSNKLVLVLGAYEMINDLTFKLDFVSDPMGTIDRKVFPKDVRRARWKIASDMKKFVEARIKKD